MQHTTTALIVGGSSGMGRDTARRLQARGHRLHLVGRDIEKLLRVQSEFAGQGEVDITALDVRDVSSVRAFADSVRTSEAHVAALVNAAGTFSPKPFLEHTVEDYDAYHDLNRGTFILTQAVADNMRRHGGGSIVNIGSMWGRQAVKATPSSAYSMAKAGLHAMTRHLAMELADHGIRVNAVAPAVVVTPIYGSFIEPDQIESTLAACRSHSARTGC